MSFSNEAKLYALHILENRRTYDHEENSRRRETLAKEIPEIPVIDSHIAELGIELLRKSLGDNSVECDALRTEIEDLTNQRLFIISESGNADKYADYHYCRKCSDSGYLDDGTFCECAVSLMKKYSVDAVNKESPLTLCSFDNFELYYYSTATNLEYGSTPRKAMEKNQKNCRNFANNFPVVKDLLLMGDTGLGKTHLALSIAKEVIDKGYAVVYSSAPTVLSKIENEHFNGSSTSTLDSVKEAELLILDDLGAEFMTPFIQTVIYDIYNTRVNAGRHTVITTNFTSVAELEGRYGEKISSRLLGCSRVLAFFGEDIRLMGKK